MTLDNRDEFIKLLLDARMSEASQQVAAIRQGLFSVVPQALFRMLSWQVSICHLVFALAFLP